MSSMSIQSQQAAQNANWISSSARSVGASLSQLANKVVTFISSSFSSLASGARYYGGVVQTKLLVGAFQLKAVAAANPVAVGFMVAAALLTGVAVARFYPRSPAATAAALPAAAASAQANAEGKLDAAAQAAEDAAKAQAEANKVGAAAAAAAAPAGSAVVAAGDAAPGAAPAGAAATAPAAPEKKK